MVKSSDPGRGLRIYSVYLSRNKTPFPCPLCGDIVVSSNFESHCSFLHNFDAKQSCVWCLGEVSWPNRQKRRNADHIIQCWRKFMKLFPSVPTTPGTEPVPFDMTPMDPKKNLFEHEFDPPPGAYDPVWPMPLDPNPLVFKDDALNMAVACMRKYLELGEEAEWHHVMVRTIAFPDFLRAMDADAGRSRTLPFSCWCDGGEPTEPRHRQHRHMIVVSLPGGHFARNVWSRISPEDRPRKNFKCIHSENLVSAMHLVNTLGYLCKRTSRCNFNGENKNLPEKQNHFYLFEELPVDYRLPLVLQWDGGILELLNQEFKNMKMSKLVEAVLEFFNARWHFQIKNIPGIALTTVLPVADDLHPCPHETGAFLHLVNGRKLHFERNPNLGRLPPEAWLRTQAVMGNRFYGAVGEETWTPRPAHQALINEFKPLVNRNRELEKEVVWLKSDREALKRKLEETEETERQWKRRCEALEQEAKQSEQEVKILLKKINQMHEEEIGRLKMDLAELKAELAEVKKENAELKTALKEKITI